MANNYWRGTTNSNSNTATNWSLGVVPTSNDGHVATWDASSPNCTINATLSCNHTDFSAYTNTVSMSNNIIVYGNITLGASMLISGSSYLRINSTTSTITSNGKVWTNTLSVVGSSTITLVGSLTVAGLQNSLSGNYSLTINKTTNETFTSTNGLMGFSGGSFDISGNADIYVTGGAITTNGSSSGVGSIISNLYLNGNISTNVNDVIKLSNVTWLSGTFTNGIGSKVIFPNACTINTSGMYWNNVEFSGSNTKTLSSNLNLRGLFTASNTSDNIVSNGFAINCASLKSNLTTGTMTGTTVINLSGLGVNASSTGISNTINTATPTENIFTGATANWNTATNWSQGTIPTATDGYLTRFNASSPNCTVNASSMAVNAISFSGYTNTITMTNGLGIYGNTTLASGMSISGSGALTFNASGLLTSNGKTWSTPIIFSSNLGVNQLSGNWTNSGLCTITSANTISINKTSTEKLVLSGGLTHTGTTTNTAQIQMTGGTWSGSGVFNGDLDFNGNCSVSGSVNRGTGTITRTSGTITTTSSTITFNNSATITVNGVTWNNIAFATTPITITMDRDLTINGTMTLATTHTFVGAYNMTIPTLTLSGSGRTMSLTGNLTISTAFNSTGSTSASRNVINSSSGGVKRNITLNTGATHDLSFVDFTDINANNGQPIWSYKGTISNCNNVLRLDANSFVESQIILA
jgi:hypothetical protein